MFIDPFLLQGRGGPGMVANAVVGDSSLNQAIGVSVAMSAGTVLAQALGAPQINIHSQPTPAGDPLTLHLAKMSKNQLIEIVSEMKAMATQNKEQARLLFLACPPLSKAILQALILLGLVPPHMLQMPNIRQASGSLQPLRPEGMVSQLSATQNLAGVPPIPHDIVQYNTPDNPLSADRPISMLNNQQAVNAQFLGQPLIQLPNLLHQGQSLMHSGNFNLPTIRPQPQGNFPFRPPVATSLLMQQGHQLQQLGPVTRPAVLDQGFQLGGSFLSGVPDSISKDPRKQVINSRVNDNLDPRNHPSKLMRLNDGRPVASSSPENAGGTSGNQQAAVSDKQALQLPPDVESALLEQVLNLTSEQLSSLPPDQQQEVIQLQQMLRQAS
ncbi:OLC1v1005384C2 [Oldenlandia corymbosa var. corymbosa]|uniref:OLC1v1005384C2 n=1 Tax=Oldenlandia corymbosa var. corymbosa TaxID=529605 RepID=A0AAV1DHD8_OLDCO|nr:OLC1v1005384C2 [Oldenlandia corymbosa var. corymbosa]